MFQEVILVENRLVLFYWNEKCWSSGVQKNSFDAGFGCFSYLVKFCFETFAI
jgi:hypothetical protein